MILLVPGTKDEASPLFKNAPDASNCGRLDTLWLVGEAAEGDAAVREVGGWDEMIGWVNMVVDRVC